MSDLLIPSFLVSDVSKSLRSRTKNEPCERIAQVAHQKWANERIAHFFERIAPLLSFFAIKTSDSLRKPMSEFPALQMPYNKAAHCTMYIVYHVLTTIENSGIKIVTGT